MSAVVELVTLRERRAQGAALAVAIAAERRGFRPTQIADEAARTARLVLLGMTAARAVSIAHARLRQTPGGVA